MPVTRRLLLHGCLGAGALLTVGRMGLHAQPGPRIVAITARRFVYDPAEVTLKLGEPVIFRLTTLDVVMGFSVPDFATRATIAPGQVTEVAMTPNRLGDFIFLCDVFCGSGHESMEGVLHVVA